MSAPAPRPNQPCPCGSGKKYKKCCGKIIRLDGHRQEVPATVLPQGEDEEDFEEESDELDISDLLESPEGLAMVEVIQAKLAQGEVTPREIEETINEFDLEEKILEFLPEPGAGGLTEDEAMTVAQMFHPDWPQPLPEHMPGPDGEPMNPTLHLAMHVMVERQIADDSPKGIADASDVLFDLGLTLHESRHELMRCISTDMWHMLVEGHPFDEKQYLKKIRGSIAILKAKQEAEESDS